VFFTDVAGNAESASAVVGVLPLVTIADNTLSVAPNGSVPLEIGVIQEPTPDDTISVTISFSAGAQAPTISAVDGATGRPVTSGGITTYTFGLADVSSGLNFTNHGDQSDVLTVEEILNGNTLGSTQTITIADPPVSGAVMSQASSNALKISSGTFELNNGSLQTSLISIALAGIFIAEPGTYALSTPIANNGQFILDSNGTTVDITGGLSGLGSFTINTGASLQFGTGAHTISGSTTDNGKIEVTNGTLEIAGAISGTGSLQVDAGAILQLDGADSLNVAFTSSTGRLILKDPVNFTGTISGLTGNDQVDLANINWQAAQLSSVSYSPTTNVTTLVITDGQHTSTILLVGDYTSSTWTFSSDGNGGTIVVDPLKTVVAISVTDSTAVVDTTTSPLDLAHSSNSSTADNATTTNNDSDAPPGVIFTFAGLDLSSDHIRFEDTNAHSTASDGVVDNDGSSNAHSALLWLANFVPNVADDHSVTLLPPDWELELQSNNGSQSAKPAVAHVELESSYSDGGKNLSFIDPPSQAAPHISSTVPAANPSDSVALPSLPTPALDAPTFDHDASPPTAYMPTADADQQFDDLPRHAKAHLPSEIPAADLDDHDSVRLPSLPTATFDASAFGHKEAPTVDSDPGHAGATKHADGFPNQSAEHEFSNASADGAADRPHHSSSSGATIDLSDDPAAHSAHAHADSSPQPIQLPNETAALPSSNIPADGDAHRSAPPSLHALAVHAVPDSPGHAVDHVPLHADAAPQLIASTIQTATHPLPSYMVSLPTDQFQFSDLNTSGSHHVPQASDAIPDPPAAQALIEATTPIDHTGSVNEIPTIPGTELLMSHSHQAAAHAHSGIV
jgi:hypothetical protein